MRSIKEVVLALALLLTANAREVQEQEGRFQDYPPGDKVQDAANGGWAERRIWRGGIAEDGGGKEVAVEASYEVIPGREIQGGEWSAAFPIARNAYEDDSVAPWDISASESEARGVYSVERTRWMPSKSRYRPKQEEQDDNAEIPLQEHQRRQRLQLQQQLLKRPTEGARRGALQLENLGGGILVGGDEDEEDDTGGGDEGQQLEEEIRSLPPPTRKLPAPRPPIASNAPAPGKPPLISDLKSILKLTGPVSLSEILQKKNLSLEDLLRGSHLALSAVAQSTTSEDGGGATRNEQKRRRRPIPTGSRPLLKRRRPTPAVELNPIPVTQPTTTQKPTTTTTQTTTQRPTTTTTTTTEDQVTTVSEPEGTTIEQPVDQPSLRSSFTSIDDLGRDILEIILQEDESDGPSLAEVLSSRNMTVADLIEQRERASGRSAITTLFPSPFVAREWKKEEDKKNNRDLDERKGRKFAHFDLMEANWDDSTATKTEVPLPEKEPEEEVVDQQVTQSRNTYQIIPSHVILHPPVVGETKIIHPQAPSLHEIPELQEEGHRPLIRTRVTASSTTKEEYLEKKSTPLQDTEEHHSQRVIKEDFEQEEATIISGLPAGVKSAIIASTSLLGIALLIFLSIFAAFRYRQWRRRRGLGPYLCVAVLEAAAGGMKNKGPKIVKQGKTKEKGWADTFDSAQARLWRTLRRGRCRFYNWDNGQM